MSYFRWIVITTMAGLAILVGGCATTEERNTQDQSSSRVGITLDDKFLKIAEKIPGFGGMFFDEHGVLNVYMKALEEQPNTSAIRDLKARVAKAIKEVMGKNFFQQARDPHGDFAKEPLSKRGEDIKIIKGEYDVLQLVEWRKSLDKVLGVPGIVFTDMDEQQNRLKVGIEDSTTQGSIEAQLNNLGVPSKAVIIEVVKPIRFQATLRDRRRPVRGGFQIEADTGWFSYKICTFGFNAIRNGRNGFVTNSHCTETQGGSNGTDFHQPYDPWYSEGNKIGDENVDPAYFTDGDCPAGKRCRFSDTAFIAYTVRRGQDIARTTNDNGSITLDDSNPIIRIVSETEEPIDGVFLYKVGRTTGWAFGSVNGTCRNIQVKDTDIVLFCQFRVVGTGDNRVTDNGDSGSPVFGLSGNEASLYGILWGGPDDGSSFVFSPIGSIEQELGPLTTIFPPPPEPEPGSCPRGQRCCEDLPNGTCILCIPQNAECP